MKKLDIDVYDKIEDIHLGIYEQDQCDFLALSDRNVMNSDTKKNIIHFNNHYSYNQLKNKDSLIMFLVDILKSLFVSNCIDKNIDNVLLSIEEMFIDHYYNPLHSRLKYLIDDVGIFFTKLPISKAFHTYNKKYQITKRLYAPPTFNEVRHILNLAQILSLEDGLDLLTFDADETLYPDGHDFHDEVLASYISILLKKMNIAIVTAACYNNDAEKYQKRLENLLKYFSKHNIEDGSYKNFYVMGGESNYLFKCNEEANLYSVPEKEWIHYKKHVDDETIQDILNISQKCLEQVIKDFKLCAKIQRKEKSIGLVPEKMPSLNNKNEPKNYMIKYEVLEEAVIRIKKEIIKKKITAPYCAFNGGQDLWVDIGNKAEGLLILQKLLKIEKKKCCHIGDQFLHSGNDFPTRFCSLTLWVSNPQETKACLKSIMNLNIKSFVPEVLYESS
ncbi:IMP-specific 5'-nucleotidase, putative [Plasmodium gallinaceum]|uniref:IMP-specific 5'-nucleotidase 1 n=1 Tax=Plasmodium gallinaceum TaxID=5849 RepID=A0A1J1GTY6_PLAGA|nr:IMP-specific 5'-nucleotidase, putative [Plasmodium gallinaceum]CRG95946.1 IMP-specific 5'-nucleotidase, putative [Plasmodium gallinaceum]